MLSIVTFSGACAPRVEGPLWVIDDLEGLAFVPAGRTPRDAALDVGCEVDLLVDRFEVTRARWLQLTERQEGPWGPTLSVHVPATHITLEEAVAVLALRGLRLPTVDEWLWCAVGPRASAYPFARAQEAIANTSELDLGRPIPVGSFEAGQTPETGIFDLLGNVRELALLPLPLASDAGRTPATVAPAPIVYAMGGSFDLPSSPTFSRFGRAPGGAVLRDRISGHARLADVGTRGFGTARHWLNAYGDALSRTEWRDRVRAVGARWGARAAPLLRELTLAPDAPPALTWLLEGAQ
ncbi:MAG: SUMF1/EgtB/PvdO family nonheme iron enzyme [Planctomycetota bacterium]